MTDLTPLELAAADRVRAWVAGQGWQYVAHHARQDDEGVVMQAVVYKSRTGGATTVRVPEEVWK